MTIEITEKQLSQQVEDLLDTFGWRWCHFRAARTEHGWRTALSGHKGFPDYIATRPPRLLIFELKSEKGKLSPAQEEWLESLRECVKMITLEPIDIRQGRSFKGKDFGKLVPSLEVYLWRPSQFEEIAEILR